MEKNEIQEAVNGFFRFIQTCIKQVPDEDKCHQLLDGLLRIAKLVKDPVVADNFEAKWLKTKKQMEPYADPATLRFYEIELNLVLKKILAPARAEI